VVEGYEAALPEGAWPNWVLGNHDRPRIATRVGREQARLTQMLLLTLRGTPTCYYGEELGMQDIALPREVMQDPLAREHPEYSRDPVRSPMQWDGSANAGFSPAGIKPWLPVANDYQTCNVAAEQQDPGSFLMLTRALLAFRRSHAALTRGSYQSVEQQSATCFVYLRQHADQRCLVALNFSSSLHIWIVRESSPYRRCTYEGTRGCCLRWRSHPCPGHRAMLLQSLLKVAQSGVVRGCRPCLGGM